MVNTREAFQFPLYSRRPHKYSRIQFSVLLGDGGPQQILNRTSQFVQTLFNFCTNCIQYVFKFKPGSLSNLYEVIIYYFITGAKSCYVTGEGGRNGT